MLLLGLAGCTSARPSPRLAAQTNLVEADITGGCIRAATELLRAELVEVASGRPDLGQDVVSTLSAAFGPDVMARAEWVNEGLLATASGDLLTTFHRDVTAQVRAYFPRITAGCTSR